MNGEPLRPVPKPVKREKEPRRLQQVSDKRAARIAAGEERPGMKRSFIRPQPPRRLETEDAGRMQFAREQMCVGLVCFPGHVCRGETQASHERNPMGELPTGTGRKEDARKTCPMCAGLHLDEWERKRGPFKGWSKEQRHVWKAERDAETNAAWDALTEDAREWWQDRAALVKTLQHEARRAFA